MPIRNAFASLVFAIFAFRPLPAMRSAITASLPQYHDSALTKALLCVLLRKSTPSGVQVEGLIQAARRRLGSLTVLLAPTDSGLSWPGGLDSPIISSILLRARNRRALFELTRSLGGRIYLCLTRHGSAVKIDWHFFQRQFSSHTRAATTPGTGSHALVSRHCVSKNLARGEKNSNREDAAAK